jgi:hypothetical protein
MKRYDVEFRLRKGLDRKTKERLEGKYGEEYGFGMNPPATIVAKDFETAKTIAKRKCPKHCVISSLKLER